MKYSGEVWRKRRPEAVFTDRPWMFGSVTVSPDNYVGLRNYFQMEGMAFRITQLEGQDRMDPDRTHHNLWNVYQYRGIADSTVYKDPQTTNLLRNYSAAFQQLALLRYREGQIDQAIQEMERYRTLKITDSPLEKSLLLQFYAEAASHEKAENLARDMAENNGTFDGYIILSDAYRRQGQFDDAVAVLERGLADMPQFTKGYEQLAKVYYAQGDTNGVVQTLERWLEISPEDSVVQETLKDLQQTSSE